MKKWGIWAALGTALTAYLLWGNLVLMVSEYTVSGSRIPEGFDGFRIAQISDLHNASFGTDNQKLLSMLKETAPDIIVITGDMVDSRRTDIPTAIAFAENAVKIAPCYYVTGNHESRISQLSELLDALTGAGVTVLRNEALLLSRNSDTIRLVGVDDPAFCTDYLTGDSGPVLEAALSALAMDEDAYTILLSHRPEWFRLYQRFGIDLVFSGHAHGGQFRLPVVGGLIAPNQGLFPEYDSGVFREGNTVMVVSRGLGSSIIPLRVGNRPEIVAVQLQRQED